MSDREKLAELVRAGPEGLAQARELCRSLGVPLDLNDANLSGADLTRADLSGAILTEADLTGANLTDAILEGSKLSGAVLADACLDGVQLTGLDLSGVDLSGVDPTPLGLSPAQLDQLVAVGVEVDPDAPLSVRGALGAAAGDAVALLWENADDEEARSLRFAVFGDSVIRGVLPLPSCPGAFPAGVGGRL